MHFENPALLHVPPEPSTLPSSAPRHVTESVVLQGLFEQLPLTIDGAFSKEFLKRRGVVARNKTEALQSFSRINVGKKAVHVIPLDFDEKIENLLDLLERLPLTPNLLIKNIQSGHVQAWYILHAEDVVYKSKHNHAPYEFLKALRKHMKDVSGSDPHHHNYLTYNPWHKDFETSIFNENPFNLRQIQDGFDMPMRRFEETRDYAPINTPAASPLGKPILKPLLKLVVNGRIPVGKRNTFVFEQTRRLMYPFKGLGEGEGKEVALEAARDVNNLHVRPLLPDAEVRNIATSVAGYIFKNKNTIFNMPFAGKKERNQRDVRLYKKKSSFRDRQGIAGKETARLRKIETRKTMLAESTHLIHQLANGRILKKLKGRQIKDQLRKKMIKTSVKSRQTINRHWDKVFKMTKSFFLAELCPNGNISLYLIGIYIMVTLLKGGENVPCHLYSLCIDDP